MDTDGDFHPWIATAVPSSMERVTGPEPVSNVIFEGVTDSTVPNTPDRPEPRESSKKMTGRTRASVSPVMAVAITSISSGFPAPRRSKLMENLPSGSGRARRPFTLRVASGEVTPVTDIRPKLVTRLTSGEVRRSIRAWV